MLKLSGLTLTTLVLANVSFAGGCPAGKEGPMPIAPETETIGKLVVQEHARMDLGKESIKADGWNYRARSILFETGTVVQLHSHDDRPEVVMMKHGNVTIYETNCTVPYTMKEGEVFTSGLGDSHWAINESGSPAVMFVVDIFSRDSFPSK